MREQVPPKKEMAHLYKLGNFEFGAIVRVFHWQISMDARSITSHLNSSGLSKTLGLIGGKWRFPCDGKTIIQEAKLSSTIREVLRNPNKWPFAFPCLLEVLRAEAFQVLRRNPVQVYDISFL
ncbi:hypothetical protein PIB30_023546 [Stylosanthes scabra]|uniref:Uncharacterized protein n=1 Tax=Stylosanthes scabra TaxID=79078 RepID=A0ABU6V8H2_9FABA|nr:hypothetical protein [Stylosanthes scabra]